MSDAFERLRAANPVPAVGRVGSAPNFREMASARSQRPGQRLLLAAAVVAVIGGVPAAAVGLGVVEFGSAEPAPVHVVKDFESLGEAAPRGMNPHVVAGEARQLTVDGRLLWVAPTRAGGLCYGWAGSSGGCDRLGTVPLSVTWVRRRGPRAGSPAAAHVVEGYAHARWVDRIEIRLDNGDTVRPRLTWISEPIDAGFFRYVAPETRGVVAVVGFRDGEEVTSDGLESRPAAHPYALLQDRKKLVEVQTSDGPVRLWAAPTRTDGRCVWLEFNGDESPVAPCVPQGYERQAGLALRIQQFGDTMILTGLCGYAGLQLTRADNASRRVICHDGVIFAPLESSDLDGVAQPFTKTGELLQRPTVELARVW